MKVAVFFICCGFFFGAAVMTLLMQERMETLECIAVCGSEEMIHSSSGDFCRCYGNVEIKNKESLQHGERKSEDHSPPGRKRF